MRGSGKGRTWSVDVMQAAKKGVPLHGLLSQTFPNIAWFVCSLSISFMGARLDNGLVISALAATVDDVELGSGVAR